MEIIPEKDSKFKQNNEDVEDDILNQSGYQSPVTNQMRSQQ